MDGKRLLRKEGFVPGKRRGLSLLFLQPLPCPGSRGSGEALLRPQEGERRLRPGVHYGLS